jgi:DNA-binding phage protein
LDFNKAVKGRLKGRTQVWLADEIGLSKQHLNGLLKAKKRWELVKMCEVANALGIRLSTLIKEAEQADKEAK